MSRHSILNRWTRGQIWSGEAVSLRKAAELAVSSGANLSAADLRDADLSGADLSGADLSYANLSAANLSAANLSAANLSYANLSAANLSAANLSDANLSDSNCLTAQGDFLRLAGTCHAVIAIDEENVSIGCMRHPLSWWREHYAAVGRAEKYTPAQVEEYRLHIEYVGAWLALRQTQREAEKAQ